MTTISVWDYVVFALMLLGSTGIGVYHGVKNARKQTSQRDYFLGGNTIGWFPLAISIVASALSAIALMGFPSEVYTNGIQFLWFLSSVVISSAMGLFVYLPIYRNLKLISVNEYLERRYCKRVRIFGCVMTILCNIFYLAVVLYTPSLALQAVAGVPLYVSIATTAIVCNIYTAIGGLKGVVWTDVFQTIVMAIGLIMVIAMGSHDVGGFGNVLKAAKRGGRLNLWNFDPSPLVRNTFWTLFIGGALTMMPAYGCNQMLIQRAVSVKSLRDMKKTVIMSTIGVFMIGSACLTAGLVMYAVYEHCDLKSDKKIYSNDQIVPYFLVTKLVEYPGVPGIIMASLFSAALSTISSGLNALAAATYEDIISSLYPNLPPRIALRVNTGISFVYGMIVMGLALLVPHFGSMVIQLTFSIKGILNSPYFGMFALGIFVPWADSKGAIVGCLSGIVLPLWMKIGSILYPPNKDILPVSTDGCSSFNGTNNEGNITYPVEPHDNSLASFYSMSYMWYAGLSLSVCFIVGSLVSLIGGRKKEMQKELLFDYKKLLPRKLFKRSEEKSEDGILLQDKGDAKPSEEKTEEIL